MPFDRATEAIAHFIGVFQLDVEAARMRDSYDAFRAEQDDIPPPENLPDIIITVRAPYDLKGFDPGVDYQSNHVLNSFMTLQAIPAEELRNAPTPSSRFAETEADEPQMIRTQSAEAPPYWDIPLPNSIVTVTIQHLSLSDNDVVVSGHDIVFLDPAIFASQLTELVELAQDLSLGMSGILEPGYTPSVEEVLDVYAKAKELDGTADEGASVTVMSGGDASGIVVNGVHVDDMPDFKDNLPAALREDEEEEDAAVQGPDIGDDGPTEEDDANPYQIDTGHHVVAGGNISANEAFIGMNWVDAGVIAVMGDVIRLDLISQTNVISDRDSGGPVGAPSSTVNAAQIEMISSDPDGVATANSGDPVFPAYWQVETVEGDVVSLNWTQQHIFATDHDRAEVEFSGSNTFIGLGENFLGNLTSIVELGFHYDLIFVGGSMITMNMIEQINVLLDSDLISGAIEAVDALGMGENYLQNSATISTTGIDTVTEMADAFAADAAALANGAATISEFVATDALFAGQQALSVLYITGDLIKLNAIEQHNYVGDSDQVFLALQDFVAGIGDDVTVTTGSNALLNDAHIRDTGIDSVVMAAGEVYSDALIHQAELIDTDALPSGVTAALTNEAIAAFLSSDMIDAAPAVDDGAGAALLTADSGSLDVMASVLA